MTPPLAKLPDWADYVTSPARGKALILFAGEKLGGLRIAELEDGRIALDVEAAGQLACQPQDAAVSVTPGRDTPQIWVDGVAWPLERVCPDDGTCHHRCKTGACFRVLHAGPLSAARYAGDRWPDRVVREHQIRPDMYGL